MEEAFIVYAKIVGGHIVDVLSSAFLPDPDGWTAIAEGFGDRYLHAQGNFFPSGLRDAHGNPLWRVAPVKSNPDETPYETYAGGTMGIYREVGA